MKGYVFSIALISAGLVGLTVVALHGSRVRPGPPAGKPAPDDGKPTPMGLPRTPDAGVAGMTPGMAAKADAGVAKSADAGAAKVADAAVAKAVDAAAPKPEALPLELTIQFDEFHSKLTPEQKAKIRDFVAKHGRKVLYNMQGYAGERRKRGSNRKLARFRCSYVRAQIRAKGVKSKRVRCRAVSSRKKKEPEWRRVVIKVVK